MAELSSTWTPAQLRRECRAGRWTRPTAGLAKEYVQASLVSLPREAAFDFLLFCQRNPKPCPLLEVLEAGEAEPACAPGADLRSDLPRYRVYQAGQLAGEVADVTSLWREDLVSFLIGCSFSFEEALTALGIPMRHLDRGCNVPMYRTSKPCESAGRFSGPLVVSMRPIPAEQVALAVQVTARFEHLHGAPVHVGVPEALGIGDLGHPDYGDAVEVRAGELPVFWACGVTAQAVAVASKLPFCITHSPGHMFVSDLPVAGPRWQR